MPLPTIPANPYPAVPALPGVPLLNTINSYIVPIVDAAVLLAADAVAIFRYFQPPQWGFFAMNSFLPLIPIDTVIEFSDKSDAPTIDYPIEQGAFGSLNKVQRPEDIRATVAVSGTVAERAAFLNALLALKQGLQLISFVTPEVVYRSLNVVHFDLRRRRESGAQMLTVDVWMTEIRPIATATFSQTQQPQDTDPQDNGAAQPASPTPAQAAATSEPAT